jgi:hypothetical protein
MSGTQTTATVGTGNGTRRGRPPQMKAASKRKRRTRAQIAAAQTAQPAAATEAATAKLPRDAVLTFAEQTRTRMLALSPAEQIAAKAWLNAAYGGVILKAA